MTIERMGRWAFGAGVAGLALLFLLGRFGGRDEPGATDGKRPVETFAAAGSREERTEARPRSTPPIDLLIYYEPGGAATGGVVLVSISSQRARNAAFDRELSGKYAFYKSKVHPVEPVELQIPREEWLKRIFFSVEGDAAAGGAINTTYAIRKWPGRESVKFTALEGCELIIEIPAAAKPPAGARMSANLELGVASIVSNAITVPSPPAGPAQDAVLACRAHQLLEAGGPLQEAADNLIKADPAAFAGYWFLGQALEMGGHVDEALAAYEDAWRRSPPLVKSDEEAPFHLMFRLQELSLALAEKKR